MLHFSEENFVSQKEGLDNKYPVWIIPQKALSLGMVFIQLVVFPPVTEAEYSFIFAWGKMGFSTACASYLEENGLKWLWSDTNIYSRCYDPVRSMQFASPSKPVLMR